MNNIPYGFLSPVLAQEKILKNLGCSSHKVPNCVIMDTNPCNDRMPNISTKPNLHQYSAVSKPVSASQDIRDLLIRVSKKAYENMQNSDRGRQIISKAARYNIPFDKDDMEFLFLLDRISDWEYLLRQALELNLDWDESNYDVEGLEEAINAARNDPEHVVEDDNAQHRRDYYASIAVY